VDSALDKSLDQFLSHYEGFLFDISKKLYEARKSFLRDGYQGYAEGTIYCQDDESYKYWPVQDDGYFVGYDDPCPEEQGIIDDIEANTQFEYLACGNARLVFKAPEPYGFAVKVGRCGTHLNFGHGRRHILSERAYTHKYGDEAPILPCLYSGTDGEFGVYPLIDNDMAEQPPEDDSIIKRLQDEFRETVPDRERDHVTEHSPNFGWLNGEPIIIDYYHANRNSPMGVPDHIDGELVIEEVDRLRKNGQKKDIGIDGKTLVEPDGFDD